MTLAVNPARLRPQRTRGVGSQRMRVIRAACGDKLRDDARTYKTQRLQPSYGEASGGAKRQVERKIVPESFRRTRLASPQSRICLGAVLGKLNLSIPLLIARGKIARTFHFDYMRPLT